LPAIINARDASAIITANLIVYLIEVSPLLAAQDGPYVTGARATCLLMDLLVYRYLKGAAYFGSIRLLTRAVSL
jgi:hypothetical protein